jgi:CDP-diacylglycerol--glycerol-3-phosphate 3-phosphatidyltransferase
MLSKYGRPFFARPLSRLVDWLRDTGVTPNEITLTGFILTGVSALILGNGNFRVGGWLLFGAAMFDMLDGALARITDQSSTFGAFLDSTLDRYSESVTFFALAFFYSRQPNARTELVLIFAILVGSLMVSYVKARAEALKVECKAGWLQRPERLFLLIVGLIFGWIAPILWALAIFTNFTALQRIYEVYWRLQLGRPATKKLVKTNDNSPI